MTQQYHYSIAFFLAEDTRQQEGISSSREVTASATLKFTRPTWRGLRAKNDLSLSGLAHGLPIPNRPRTIQSGIQTRGWAYSLVCSALVSGGDVLRKPRHIGWCIVIYSPRGQAPAWITVLGALCQAIQWRGWLLLAAPLSRMYRIISPMLSGFCTERS